MKTAIRIVILLATIAAFGIGTIWFYNEGGYEPLLAVLGGVVGVASLFLISDANHENEADLEYGTNAQTQTEKQQWFRKLNELQQIDDDWRFIHISLQDHLAKKSKIMWEKDRFWS